LIRVSGEAFADLLRDQLTDALDPPPREAGSRRRHTAVWVNWAPAQGQAGWAAVANCAVEQRDACPGGIFGAIDLSVDVTATLSARVVDVPPTDHGLELNLSLANDASDWDVFRCWLGTGGIGALFFGVTVTPILGVIIVSRAWSPSANWFEAEFARSSTTPRRRPSSPRSVSDDGRVTYRRLDSLKVLGS